MVNEWTDRSERTPDVLERHYMELWESIRRDPGYASSWCSQCDVECRTALTTGLGTNPPPAQNPPPTKIPIQPKNTADKNSPPGERVRLHVVITKKFTGYCYC